MMISSPLKFFKILLLRDLERVKAQLLKAKVYKRLKIGSKKKGVSGTGVGGW